MSGFDERIRTLLEQEERNATAPAAIRLRGRERLRRTIAVGAMAAATTTSGAAAIAASRGATAVVGATSFGGTLITALTIGLCSGLVSISPTDDVHVVSRTPPARTAQTMTPVANRAPNRASGSQAALPPKTAPGALAASDDAWMRQRTAAPDGVVEPTSIRQVQAAKTPVTTSSAFVRTDAPATRALAIARVQTEELPHPRRISIMRETTLLGQAQRAINGGKYVVALGLLDQYASEYPNGTLVEEAMVSRVVTFCAMGRKNEGQDLAAAFMRQYPNSALAGRVVSACQSGTPAESSAHPASVSGESIQ